MQHIFQQGTKYHEQAGKDNMAAEITEFKLGYEWGSPIRYVQRANKGIRENNKDADNVGIAMLNEMMEEENKPSADQELARFIEICGVGYRLIKAKPDQYRFGSSVVDILTLNPMNTFIVYSNDVYRRPIMGVSYITDQNGNSTYGCYTEDTYFEVKNISKIKGESKRKKWFVSNGNGRKNIPAAIPIVEYINDYDRMLESWRIQHNLWKSQRALCRNLYQWHKRHWAPD